METIYCLSGLGADQSAFQFLDIPGHEMVFIDWIPPLKKESMEQYAARLKVQVKHDHPILLGLSFGGMMAIELAKMVQPSKVILLSSAKSKAELHPIFAPFMRLKLMHFIPKSIMHRSNFIVEYFFGVQSKREKAILAKIIAATDLKFLFWALDAMQHWDNTFVPQSLLEIHGTADKLIPYRTLPKEDSIQNGGHLMVLNHAAVISQRILAYLR